MKLTNKRISKYLHEVIMSESEMEFLSLYHDLIAAIVSAIEARDDYIASHSKRVSDMSEEICRLLKLEKRQIQIIHIAADLHDIGKIGIDDSILRKEGKLNENQWEMMKKHTIIGYSILNKVNKFKKIAKIVRAHHERWDGEGYPDKMVGEEIPLGARIIAIADSIDAMLSDRSYRKKMSMKKCKDEILGNSGKMYDERIVNIVIENWDDILLKR